MTLGRTAIGRIARVSSAMMLALRLAILPTAGEASDPGPFDALTGWWGGDGRLSFKDGKLEQVKCHATYIIGDTPNDLKQTIRCASGSGKIEVVSNVKHDAGKLTGAWTEQVYNVTGDLSGEVTPRGFRVSVTGTNGSALSANMDIILRDKKQIVEIQFFSETLVGLTLLLNKGSSDQKSN